MQKMQKQPFTVCFLVKKRQFFLEAVHAVTLWMLTVLFDMVFFPNLLHYSINVVFVFLILLVLLLFHLLAP
jgi:hypothetical protein